MKIIGTIKTTGIICLFMVLAAACSKSDDNPAPSGNNNGGNNTTPSWADTIARKWKVVAATHKGSEDASSKGLELDIRKDGSYTLVSTGYVGTWRFTDNTYKTILLDENKANFKVTWTVIKMTSLRLEIDFVSPFTGGAAHWDMEPF